MKIKLLSVFAATAFLLSCGQGPKEKQATTEEEAVVFEQLVLDSLIVKAENYIDKNVAFEGTVTHVCKHGGQKMFVFGASDEETMKVTVGENYSEFKVELEGSTVKVEGVLQEQRIDETYLAEWEVEINTEMDKESVEQEHAEGEEHDHDGDHHAKEKSHEKSAADLEKIQKLRKKIEASEKGYLSNFSVECIKYEVLDEAEEEVTEEPTEE